MTCRVLIPQSLRRSLGVSTGDIINLTTENGKIVAKKAIVIDDKRMPREAKRCYGQSAIREFDAWSSSPGSFRTLSNPILKTARPSNIFYGGKLYAQKRKLEL